MIKSDPQLTQLGFFGQYGQFETWMNSDKIIPDHIPFVPTGRLRFAPELLTFSIEWTSIDSVTKLPILPPPDQRLLFNNVLLFREAIRRQVPSSPPWVIHTVDCPFPACVYTCPHWLSNTINPNDSLNPAVDTIDDVRWFLFYGDGGGFGTVAFDNLINQTHLSTNFRDNDSVGDASLSLSGWGLAMVKRKLVQPPSDDPKITFYGFNDPITHVTINLITTDPPISVEHHVYGLWTLTPPPIPPDPPLTDPVTPPTPVFPPMLDLTRPSSWKIVHNGLLFPEHKLTLLPFKS